MNAFVDELGLRDYVTGSSRPKYFHVAGTNGKGSTTCFLQNLLHIHGFRVGACYSPYVFNVRERVQIGLDLISEEEFAACTEILLAVGERLERTEFGGPTEFEMKTAMGFLAWQRAGVDAVALETGMGGRLDATNIVDPACAIITSIGLDHTEHLGPTISHIAAEKAGIIKPDRPVVVGHLPDEALEVIKETARERNSHLYTLDSAVAWPSANSANVADSVVEIAPNLRGSFQKQNAALAVLAMKASGMEISGEKAAQAIRAASLPGRLQIITINGHQVLLDGAHNEQAARSLAEELAGQKFTLVWGMTKGHSPNGFLRQLLPIVEKVIILPARAAGDRAAEASALAAACENLEIEYTIATTAGHAIRMAGEFPAILVTGSFYLIGDFADLRLE